MAMVPMAKNTIDQNEIKYGASVSESTFTRIGASINFWNGNQVFRHVWNLNGRYGRGTTSDMLDGLFVFMTDCEVTGFSMSTAVGGTAEIDIYKLSNPGDTSGSSIFSTEPKLSNSDGDRSYLAMSLVDANGDAQPTVQASAKETNGVLPVFSTVQFNQFEAVYMKFNSTPTGDGEDLSVALYFRPR